MIKKRYIFIPLVFLFSGALVIGAIAYVLLSRHAGDTEMVFAPTDVGTPTGEKVTNNIGPAGGSLVSADGRLTLTVPQNAVSAFVTFSIQPITNKAEGGLRSAYRIEPDGATFTTPLQLSVHFDQTDLEGTVPEALSIAYQDKKGAWHDQKAARLDQAAGTVTITTTHFTDFSFLARMRLSPAEATIRAGKMLRIEVIECSEPSRWDRLMGHPAVCGSPWHPVEDSWKLRGAGTIIPAGYAAAYHAPEAKPEPNVVWADVTVLVNKVDPETGITEKAQKTLSAKITIAGKGYRVSGTAGDTVFSGVICDLDQSFKVKSNNPFMEGFEFTPTSPSFGKWQVSTKNDVNGGGDGQYALQGPADNRTGILLNGFSSGSSHGISRSGGGSFQLTLTPLSMNPTTKDDCSE